ELPEDLPEIQLESEGDMPIAAVLNQAGLVKNAAGARDMLNAGSVRIDGEVVGRDFQFRAGATHICQAGKKAFARITLKKLDRRKWGPIMRPTSSAELLKTPF